VAFERQNMIMNTPVRDQPPRWVEHLLRVLLKSRDRETIVGDLLEEYREVVLPTRGRFRAQLWYVTQALSLVDGVKLGMMLGAGFGAWNLVYTGRAPFAEDTLVALVSFYGPMFTMWSVAGFVAFRRTGKLTDAIKVGATVGLVTFVVFDVAVLVRANLFLEAISQRSDWRGLLENYQVSGFESLRTYVNYTYVTGIPLTFLMGAMMGAGSGLLGGFMGSVGRQHIRPLPSH
jgi:hypothetical protein